MLVPAAVEELDEAHAALGQPAGEQAVGGEGAGLAGVGAVQLEDVAGSFERSVSSGTEVCMRNAISYCAMRVAISGSPILVELGCRSASPGRRALRARVRASMPVGIREVEHRIADRAELDALVPGGQEAAAPEPVVERLVVRLPVPCEISTTNAGRSCSRCPGRRRARSRCSAGRRAGAGLEERDGRDRG